MTAISTLVSEKQSRSWEQTSVGIFCRPPGEVIWRSDHYRVSYVLSDICGSKQSDDGPFEEYRLGPEDITFRPPDRKLWSDLSGGRFIQILQGRNTYDSLVPELVRGGTAHLEPQDGFNDPLISQLVPRCGSQRMWFQLFRHAREGRAPFANLRNEVLARSVADEIDGGFPDGILADALNTALAVQVVWRFVDQSALAPGPSNGLSRERLKRCGTTSKPIWVID